MDNSVVVSLRDIVVEFDGQRILDGLNLDIHDKEFVTLLGPSGCGKTTTLRMIGRLSGAERRQGAAEGEDINGVPPYKREVNTVFQKYALFPHLNVFENMAFGLRSKSWTRTTSRRRCAKCWSWWAWRALSAAACQPAFRRSAAARGHRPRAGQRAGGAAAGRAAGRAGPEAAQGDAAGAQAHPAGGGHHLHLCHPRSGGGADHVRYRSWS